MRTYQLVVFRIEELEEIPKQQTIKHAMATTVMTM
jgi:hypothetical protein